MLIQHIGSIDEFIEQLPKIETLNLASLKNLLEEMLEKAKENSRLDTEEPTWNAEFSHLNEEGIIHFFLNCEVINPSSKFYEMYSYMTDVQVP